MPSEKTTEIVKNEKNKNKKQTHLDTVLSATAISNTDRKPVSRSVPTLIEI